jgi:hypothetical protein
MRAVAESWLDEPLRRFVDDARVSLALMTHTSGRVLGQSGFSREGDVMTMCALAAAINASASELGKMLDGKPFAGLHQGNRGRQAYLVSAETRRGTFLLLSIFDDSSSLGLVRLYVEELCARLADAAPVEDHRAGAALAEDFEGDLHRNLALMFGRAP